MNAHWFQCPFGHSGILTRNRRSAQQAIRMVSMPFRAFGDSDRFLLPLTQIVETAFQCPFGHSGILTYPSGSAVDSARWVSMPFRAFGDSDKAALVQILVASFGFQCPFGHSGILTKGGVRCLLLWRCFNALSGIRGF